MKCVFFCDKCLINDVFREYNALLLDIIARCGFGTKMNALDDPENPFVKHAASLISAGEGEPNFLLTVARELIV